MLEHVDITSPQGWRKPRAALLVLGLAALVPFQAVAREPPVPSSPGLTTAEGEWGGGEESFVFVLDDHVTTITGSPSDVRRARAMQTRGQPLLFARWDGKAYVIRDAKLLEQANALFEQQTKLGEQQAELGRKQAELGRKQAESGEQQAALRPRQPPQRLHQAELSRQQEALGREQGELGKQMGALARESRKKLKALVDEALRKGLAEPVGP